MSDFELNRSIAQWRRDLRAAGSFAGGDLVELELHLRDEIEALEQAGLSAAEAFLVARRRLGRARELATEYHKVKPWLTWYRPVFWFLVAMLAWPLLSMGIDFAVGGAIAAGGAWGWSLAQLQVAVVVGTLGVPIASGVIGWSLIRRFSLHAVSRPIAIGVFAAATALLVAFNLAMPAVWRAAGTTAMSRHDFAALMSTYHLAGSTTTVLGVVVAAWGLWRLRGYAVATTR